MTTGIDAAEATARMLDWPLTSRSVVLDVGAFDGTWAAAIAQRYRPQWMYLFEPQEKGAHLDRLRTAMAGANYDHYQLHPFGLGTVEGIFPMVEADTDGASFLIDSSPNRQRGHAHGRLTDAHEWFRLFQQAGGWSTIDLTSINIEGYEYELLPYLVRTGDIALLDDVAVQFHTFADPDGSRYRRVAGELAATHDLLWDAYPTWVTWRRRQP